MHRDVKPGNFLFCREQKKGYLIDFNLANVSARTILLTSSLVLMLSETEILTLCVFLNVAGSPPKVLEKL